MSVLSPSCWHVTLERWLISCIVGSFPVFTLRILCWRKPLVLGKPWRWVTLNPTQVVQFFSPSLSLYEMVIIIACATFKGVWRGVNEIIHGKCFGQLLLSAQKTLISPPPLPTLLSNYLDYLETLIFHMKFRIFLISSAKYPMGTYSLIWGRIDYLMTSKLYFMNVVISSCMCFLMLFSKF